MLGASAAWPGGSGAKPDALSSLPSGEAKATVDYLRYYLGTLMMVCGVAGFVLGGPFVWLGLATFPLLVVLDLALQRPDYATRRIAHPTLADVPLYLHVPLVGALLGAAAWRVRLSATGVAPLGPGGLAGCVLTLAWLGVLPNIPFVHDLVHRKGRLPRFLAFLGTVAIGDPLRRLGHVRGHHVKLGLADDSDTARRGETIYTFIFRAAVGGTREGYLWEKERLGKRGISVWSWRSDVVRSLALTGGVFALIGVLGGALPLAVVMAGAALSRLLLEAFNYLQHYGLVRAPGTRHERRHTWSHLTPVVRAAALEITNHAHHHMNPDVPFYALVPDADAPQMPSALLCFLAALVPPVFDRVIAMPRLREWDSRHATPEEQALAAAANVAAGWPAWSEAPAEGVAAE
jgi:alkane 1-monooxygenase